MLTRALVERTIGSIMTPPPEQDLEIIVEAQPARFTQELYLCSVGDPRARPTIQILAATPDQLASERRAAWNQHVALHMDRGIPPCTPRYGDVVTLP